MSAMTMLVSKHSSGQTRARVRVDPRPAELGSEWIIVDRGVAERLTSIDEYTFELGANNSLFGAEQLSREIPEADDLQIDTLDERGLVRCGTKVGPGSLLVGRVRPPSTGRPSAGDLLAHDYLLADIVLLHDISLYCPGGCFGTVSEACLIEPHEGELMRARVVVTSTRSLEIGDELMIDDRQRAIVAGVDALDGAVIWSGGTGSIQLTKGSVAKDVIHGRGTGPYSGVTQLPLSDKEQWGAQRLTLDQASRLITRAPQTLWEMLTVKANDIGGRNLIYRALVDRNNPSGARVEPSPKSDTHSLFDALDRPQLDWNVDDLPMVTLEIVTLELFALGIHVGLADESVCAQLLPPDVIRACSYGQVMHDKTYDDALNPVVGGVFCPRIFGPVWSFECACGKYNRVDYHGITCEVCGVEVIHAWARRHRFGHIELAAPVIHPLFFPEVALLLGLEVDELASVLAAELGLDRAGRPTSLEADNARTTSVAVHERLATLDLERLEVEAEAEPVRRLAASLRERGLSPTCFVLEVLPVLPADLRPRFSWGDDRYLGSDCSDFYRLIAKRNARLLYFRDFPDLPASISNADAALLQDGVNGLFMNERRPSPLFDHDRRPLCSLLTSVEAGLRDLGTKPVDYSAIARLVAAPSVDPRGCKLPRRLAKELFTPMVYGILKERLHARTSAGPKRALRAERRIAWEAVEQASAGYPVLLIGASSVVVRTVSLWDELAVAVDPDTARLLECMDVTVHVPLSESAKAECLEFEDCPPAHEIQTSGWLSRALVEPSMIGELLRQATLEGELDSIADPLLRAALGRPPR